MSDRTTRGIRVQVASLYVPERSSPEDGYYFFAYRVRITNEGGERVQLLRRHWRISDADGSVQDVEGPGVVGKQPVLEPGQWFEYTSFCPLRTPLGWMEGEYEMAAPGGEMFSAAIARFSLEVPHAVN